jgi:hypothetical protein
MTKQHFALIAKELNFSFNNAPSSRPAVRDLALSLANKFEAVNPRFNRSKFLAEALK